MIKGIAAGALLILVAAFVVGLAWDSESFAQNILAEIIGIIISILAAALIVDRLIQREKRRQWATVRVGLAESIRWLITDFTYEAEGYLIMLAMPHFAIEDRFGDDSPYGVSKLRNHVEALFDQLCGDKDRPPTIIVDEKMDAGMTIRSGSDGGAVVYVQSEQAAEEIKTRRRQLRIDMTSTRGMFEATEVTMRGLRDNLIPLALQLAEDPSLVELLLRAENTWRQWRMGMTLVDDDWGFPQKDAWTSFVDLTKVLRELEVHVDTVLLQ
jgi:hypothetical protein